MNLRCSCKYFILFIIFFFELSSSFCVIVCVLCVLYTLLYLEKIKNLSFAAIYIPFMVFSMHVYM